MESMVIDFAARRQKAQVIVPNSYVTHVSSPVVDKSTGVNVNVRLPWNKTINQVKTAHAKDVRKALENSNANFEVYLDTLTTPDGIKVPNRAVRRSDTKDILGVVGRNWHPLQNQKAFDWFQPILDSTGAELVNAGSVFGGRKATIIAKIPYERPIEVVKGDIIETYLKLTNSHDGSGSLKIDFLPLRLVCMNGMASCQDATRLLNTRHTAQIGARLDNIQDIIRRISDDYTKIAAVFSELAAKPLKTEEDFRLYASKALECKPDSDQVNTCVANLYAGRGSHLAGMTYWGAYNAVQEYLQWQAKEDQSKGMESLLFGSNDIRNRRALALALAA